MAQDETPQNGAAAGGVDLYPGEVSQEDSSLCTIRTDKSAPRVRLAWLQTGNRWTWCAASVELHATLTARR